MVLGVLLRSGNFNNSESHFAGRPSVDLCKNGDLLKMKMPLRGKTALNFADCFGSDHSLA